MEQEIVMIVVVNDSNKEEHREDMDKLHQLRHQVFIEQLKWPHLKSVNGREYDRYDALDATHIFIKEGEDIAAAVRLNWADKPTLMGDVFSHLVQFESLPVGSSVVDLSRFVVSPKYGSRERMNRYGCDLICAVLEYGVLNGVSDYTAVVSTHFFSTLLQWGVEAYALGFPIGQGREECVAFRGPASEASIAQLYRYSQNYAARLPGYGARKVFPVFARGSAPHVTH
jgi:acyl-homoserine lactone synthase